MVLPSGLCLCYVYVSCGLFVCQVFCFVLCLCVIRARFVYLFFVRVLLLLLFIIFSLLFLFFDPIYNRVCYFFVSLSRRCVMARRSKMARGNSKRVFTRGAQRVHPKNSARPMRGGIRL